MTARRVVGPWRGLGVVLAAALLAGLPPRAAAEYIAIDLNPSGFTDSVANGISGGQQVGGGSGPVTGGQFHALLWTGSAASKVDLNPSGFTESSALGISGGQQVGGGSGPATGGQFHALLWTGSAGSAVDLNPSGFTFSSANGISGGQQVGDGVGPATGGQFHALLWSGTAGSVVDLNPSGFTFSVARGVSGGQQVGVGTTGGHDHALLWEGSADSVVDLNAFLPTGFTDAFATNIDADGNIVGFASGPASGGLRHAFLWQPVAPVPEPGTRTLLGQGAAALLCLAWRARRKIRTAAA